MREGTIPWLGSAVPGNKKVLGRGNSRRSRSPPLSNCCGFTDVSNKSRAGTPALPTHRPVESSKKFDPSIHPSIPVF